MPFRNSNLSTMPPNPNVVIILQGHLILEPNSNGSKCDVGISRCSPDHQFSIEVREKMRDCSGPDITLMRNVGTLEFSGIDIQVAGSIDGVSKFTPGTFSRSNASSDPNDLRWMIDLSNAEFHNNQLDVDGTGTEPNIRIFDGIFYTAVRTDENEIVVTRTGGGLADLNLHRIARLIGVNIHNRVVVKFTIRGAARELALEVKPGRYYEIRINNDPAFVSPNPSDNELANHRELREYYRAINGLVKRVETGTTIDPFFPRFELQLTRPANPIPNLGSPTIPCMPIGSDTGV